MRAVITGITGFLGTHLAEHLHKCGDEVLGVCRNQGKATGNRAALFANSMCDWDLSGHATSGSIPEPTQQIIAEFQPDVIFHFAALSNPKDCGHVTPNALAMQVNVDGVRTIADFAAGLRVPPRLVFASTGHVYARPMCGAFVHEESLLEPSRGYGMTKLAAERVLRSAAAEHKLDVVIARSFQHAGPGQEPRLMLAEWASQVAANRPAPIRVFNRDTMIDITDGRDAAAAYRELALHDQSGHVYNIGAGTCQRTGEILDLLLSEAGAQREIVELEPGFRRNLIADISRITEETSWRPRVPIATTVRDTLDWWKSRIDHAKNRRGESSQANLKASVS